MISDDKIMLYIDGLLNELETAEVAAYLLENPEKSTEVARIREQNEALKAMGKEILEEPIPENLLNIINSAKLKGHN